MNINLDEYFDSIIAGEMETYSKYHQPKFLRANRYQCLLCCTVIYETELKIHHTALHPNRRFELRRGGIYKFFEAGSQPYTDKFDRDSTFKCNNCGEYLLWNELEGHHEKHHPKVECKSLLSKPSEWVPYLRRDEPKRAELAWNCSSERKPSTG